MYGYSQGKPRGKRDGWIPESGRTDLGILEETSVSAPKVGAEEISGAMAIASVGISI